MSVKKYQLYSTSRGVIDMAHIDIYKSLPKQYSLLLFVNTRVSGTIEPVLVPSM